MIGVKTIGHATLVAFDGEPLLATDPWLGGSGAYFGSWQLSHAIPSAELDEIRACPYVWISHAHPDHLSFESLELLRPSRILLPDHRGGRIRRDLEARGHRVAVLPDHRWITLSRRVRVCSIADFMQNAILLLDVNGRLFLDLNDASDRGWGKSVRSVVPRFQRSYLLKLAPTGSLGVLNAFDAGGRRLPPSSATPEQAGAELSAHADFYGVAHVVPFASFHSFQRSDSAWANRLVASPADYARTFASKRGATLLPAFVEIDCEKDAIRRIDPPKNDLVLLAPETFGDRWSEELEPEDVAAVARYFSRKEMLRDRFGFVALRVGGKEHRISLNPAVDAGVTFEAPRHSLMTAVVSELFDDILLGNFVRILLHGAQSLVPEFVRVVARFADQARVETRADVDEYLEECRRRAALPILEGALSDGSLL